MCMFYIWGWFFCFPHFLGTTLLETKYVYFSSFKCTSWSHCVYFLNFTEDFIISAILTRTKLNLYSLKALSVLPDILMCTFLYSLCVVYFPMVSCSNIFYSYRVNTSFSYFWTFWTANLYFLRKQPKTCTFILIFSKESFFYLWTHLKICTALSKEIAGEEKNKKSG
jgi:hypothetical protein